MSELQTLEQDLSNFVTDVEKDVNIVFKDIVNGTSYAEQIITNVLTDAIPVASAVVSVIAPQDIVIVNIISQVLGDIKAIAANLVNLSNQAAAVIQPGGNVSVEQATALATSAKTTYQATLSSIDNIVSQLTPIIQGAVVTIKKDV